MNRQSADPAVGSEAASSAARDFELLRSLTVLNEAFLRMLLVWADEDGVASASRAFGVCATTLTRLASAEAGLDTCRAYASEPFSFVTVDARSLRIREPGAAEPPSGERYRLLAVVQTILADLICRHSVERLVGVSLVRQEWLESWRQAVTTQRCGSAAIQPPERWIVATPLVDQRVAADRWGPSERYRAVIGLLGREARR